MAKIHSIKARPILNSRGRWTVEADLKLNNGDIIRTSVPQGRSEGSYEAVYLPVSQAVKNIGKIISPHLKGIDVSAQKKVDESLIKLDGTPNKKRLGANAILVVSIACAKAAAAEEKKETWRYLRKLSGLNIPAADSPKLFVNVINGGLHADNNLDFQEYLIIPRTKSVKESVDVVLKFYGGLEDYLKKSEREPIGIGDEGGFTPNFKNNSEPFNVLRVVSKKLRIETKLDFGLDAAASNFKMSETKLKDIYKKLKKSFGLVYLEDPFAEDEFGKFSSLKKNLGEGVMIVGDDLITTNLVRMERARKNNSINSVIIKPNQIGTVSETIAAVKLARSFGWKVIASHRSGETNDDFIADFAYGVGAYGIKLGAPNRGERIAKYNRLLEIEGSLG